MNKTEFLKNKKVNSLYAICLSIVVFLLLNVLIAPRYEMADDFVLSQFLANGRVEFVFSNIFWEKVLLMLQAWLYPLNAYVIVSTVIAICAFSLLTKIMIDRFGLLWGSLVSLLLQATFAVSCAIEVSFTIYSAFFCAIGFFAVVYYAKKKKIGGMVCGAVLAILGGLYRYNIFEALFILAAVIVFAISVSDFSAAPKEQRNIKQFLRILFEPRRFICAGLIFVFIFSAQTLSKSSFQSQPQLKAYRSYTLARSAVFDYEIVPYEQAREEYDAAGIDANDLQMIRYCMFDKDGGLSTQQLKQIRQISDSVLSKQNRLISSIKSMIATQVFEVLRFTTEGITLAVLILAFIVYCVLQKKSKILPACIMVAALVPFYIYLYAQGRAPYRVVCGMLFITILGIIYLIDEKAVKEKFEGKKALKTALCVVCAILSLCILGINIKNVPQALHPANESEAAAIQEMRQDSSAKYEFFGIETLSMDTEAAVKDVYHIAKVDKETNLFNQPATYYLTPYYLELLDNFGTDNAYRNLLNENVYAVFKNTEDRKDIETYMQQYLQKYYAEGKSVKMEKVKTYDVFNVYKYTLV